MITFILNAIKIIFLLGLLVFIHEGAHFTVAKLCKVRVSEFAIGFGPVIWKKKIHETKYAVRLIPLGGFVNMEDDEENSKKEDSFGKASIPKRIAIVAAGAITNILFGLLVYFVLASNSGVNISTKVASVDENINMQVVEHIEAGDKIIKINGKNVRNIYDIYNQLNKISEPIVNITVERNNMIKNFNVNLVKDEETGRYYIGIVLEQAENNFINNIYYGFWNTVDFSVSIIDNLKLLFTGKVDTNQLMGPVGISDVVSKTNEFREYIYIIALISLSLGVTNLLPIPPMDGGKILFLIIEGIRRKPIKKELEISIQLIGFTALVALSLFVTFNDVTRILK